MPHPEVGERGQGGDMCKELGPPKLLNFPPDQWFPCSLRGWGAQDYKGVGKVVLEADVAHLYEPGKGCGGSCAGRRVGEDVGSILVKGAISSKPCHHCQEGQLAEMENCTGRQAAS